MTPTLENIWNKFAVKLGQFIRTRVADPATVEDNSTFGFYPHSDGAPADVK